MRATIEGESKSAVDPVKADVGALAKRVQRLEGEMKALRGLLRAMPYSQHTKQALTIIEKTLRGER